MTKFRIEVPDENFARYDRADIEAAGRLIARLSEGRVKPYMLEHTCMQVFIGENESQAVVTIIAAMAQGHSLQPIIDKILSDLVEDIITESEQQQ